MLSSHGLLKRAITLTTLASQSLDATAQAFGLDPARARRYYLDARQPFDGSKLLKRMAVVLKNRPQSKRSTIRRQPAHRFRIWVQLITAKQPNPPRLTRYSCRFPKPGRSTPCSAADRATRTDAAR